MTEQRDLHHQRHRARHRLAAPPVAGGLLHQGGDRTAIWRRSFRTADPGSSSSTTRRACSTSGSIESESSSDGLPPSARPQDRRADPPAVLHPDQVAMSKGKAPSVVLPSTSSRQEEASEQVLIRGRREIRADLRAAQARQDDRGRLVEKKGRATRSTRRRSKRPTSSPTWSISPPARSSSRPRELSPDVVDVLRSSGIADAEVIFPDWDLVTDVLLNTIRKDSTKTFEAAIIEIYRRMRPGDPPTLESAKDLFEGMFFDSRKYDFSRVGGSSSTSSSI